MTDLEQMAIERLKTASDMSLANYGLPLIITDSGGKDSSVVKELARRSGIPFEIQHNHTTADAPETVRFVRQEAKRFEELGIKYTINMNGCNTGCSENMMVNRYELGQNQKISSLESALALRDANIYGDQKLLEVYKYFDGELKDIRNTLCAQAVTNQKTADSFALASADLAAVRSNLEGQIRMEAERRCCGDNAIVTYANATFYPKLVADVTAGTTTTAQVLYNPIPSCGGCCGK